MSGIRDQQSRLWRVDLKESTKSNHKAAFNHAHETNNLKAFINYLHVTALSPVK
jgi:hypothetical protein